MRRATLCALALAACAQSATPPAGLTADEVAALTARTQLIGAAVRAAAACDRPLSMLAQDQAARLETAMIALRQAKGGAAERDAFLAPMRPPEAASMRGRIAWCARQRPDLAGVERFLTGETGQALIQRAEAVAPH